MKNLRTAAHERVDALCARAVVRLNNISLNGIRARGDRGDVPGWVLISVMTAGLTTAVWLIADEQLTGILDRAMASVSTP